MNSISFERLGLAKPLLGALATAGYREPTPIQEKAIPPLLVGHDLLGIAQTGTGKTAAFTLPLLHRLAANGRAPGRRPAALILAPTRELVLQIGQSLTDYGRQLRLRHTIVIGGVSIRPQITAVRAGVDIVVATPGRLLDLIGERHIDLSQIEVLVLDEADRMLDMGFIRDVRRIVSRLPVSRQTALFSATMPPAIATLAAEILRNPDRVEIASKSVAVDRIAQEVHHMPTQAKRARLGEMLTGGGIERAIVFTRTKHGADKVARHLASDGVRCGVIHGNKSQNARQNTLAGFRVGKINVLIATDIAARGIDVDGITHVINYEMPVEPETYVHRIGRTARAGANGIAISFCDAGERGQLRAIEKLLKRPIAVVGATPSETAAAPARTSAMAKARSEAPRHNARPRRRRHFRARAA